MIPHLILVGILIDQGRASTSTSCASYFDSRVVSSTGPGEFHSDCLGSRIDRGQTRYGSASANVFVDPTHLEARVSFDDYRFAPIGVSGNAERTELYYVTIDGGTGSALFNPCLEVGGVGGTEATASAGPRTISMSAGSAGSRTCNGPGMIPNPASLIPFTFGESQVLRVSVSARASTQSALNNSGATSAIFRNSLEVWLFEPTSVRLLSTASYTIAPVPEPATALPLAAGLALCLAMAARNGAGRRAGTRSVS